MPPRGLQGEIPRSSTTTKRAHAPVRARRGHKLRRVLPATFDDQARDLEAVKRFVSTGRTKWDKMSQCVSKGNSRSRPSPELDTRRDKPEGCCRNDLSRGRAAARRPITTIR